jgi:nucleoside-diphosphate-sugar epimerase
MQVLVSGAGGFVGTALCEHLVASGYSVRAMTRKTSDSERLRSIGTEPVLAELSDIESLKLAVQGVEKVFHIAALFRQAGLPDSEFFKVNVEGTKNLLDCAIEAGVNNFVHCSTVGVCGHIENPPGTELTPYNPGDPYQASKMEGEKLFLSYVREGKIKGTVIRPAMIYGPHDTRTLKLFKTIAAGKFFYVGPGDALVHFIDVRDLAKAFRLASEAENVNGEVFIISGQSSMKLKEMCSIIAAILGVKEPWLHLPVKPMQAIGSICEAICTPLRINPPIYRRRVDFFTKDRSFDSSKAERLLGFKPSQVLVQEILDIISSYISSGAIDVSKLREPVAVLRDFDGRIHSWGENARSVYGWTAEQALGSITHSLFSTAFPENLQDINKKLSDSGYWIGPLLHKDKEGKNLKVRSKWKLINLPSLRNPLVLELNHLEDEFYDSKGRFIGASKDIKLFGHTILPGMVSVIDPVIV